MDAARFRHALRPVLPAEEEEPDAREPLAQLGQLESRVQLESPDRAVQPELQGRLGLRALLEPALCPNNPGRDGIYNIQEE